MPRVLLNKEAHMSEYFTDWIVAQMHRQKITRANLGKQLNITGQAVGLKLRSNQYSFQDFIIITKYLNASEEDLIKLTKI